VCFTEANKHWWGTVCFWRDSPQWATASSFTRFLDHTTTHHSRQDSSGRVISSSQISLPDNTQHSQQISMPPVGFKSTISAGERSQTHALDRVATGTCSVEVYRPYITLLPTSIIEWKAKLQLQVCENRVVNSVAPKFTNLPEIYPQAKIGCCKRSQASPAFPSDSRMTTLRVTVAVIVAGEDQSTQGKPCPSATSFITNLVWPSSVSKPSREWQAGEQSPERPSSVKLVW
jgi:hypothetical protein